MSKVIDYILVFGDMENLDQLEMDVRDLIIEGWEPLGNPCLKHKELLDGEVSCAQAMIKREYSTGIDIEKWFGVSKTDPEPWIPKLPSLGQTLLAYLVQHYGADMVAKAAHTFVEASKREEVLRQAKQEIDAMLEAVRAVSKQGEE